MDAELSRKKYGDYLRTVREGLGLDREQFARRIGVSAMTVRNCENGHQSLGRAAKRAVEILADPRARFTAPNDVSEVANPQANDSREQGAKTVARIVAQIMADPALQERAQAVQAALGVSYERAVEIMVREMME